MILLFRGGGGGGGGQHRAGENGGGGVWVFGGGDMGREHLFFLSHVSLER